MFSGFYCARSSRRSSREVAVSKAASAHSSPARIARMTSEGTDTATGMSAAEDRNHEPGNAHAVDVAQPESVVPKEIEGDAPAQRTGRDGSEWIPNVGHSLLDAQSDQDD